MSRKKIREEQIYGLEDLLTRRIKHLQHAKKMKGYQIAELIGVSASHYSEILRKKKPLKLEHLEKLCLAVNWPLGMFFKDIDAPESLGNKIQVYRLRKGLELEEFAEMIGESVEILIHIEDENYDSRQPPYKKIEEIAKKAGIDLEWLYFSFLPMDSKTHFTKLHEILNGDDDDDIESKPEPSNKEQTLLLGFRKLSEDKKQRILGMIELYEIEEKESKKNKVSNG